MCVALFGAGIWWATAGGGGAAEGYIDEARQYVGRADVTIVQLDDLLNTPVSRDSLEQISAAREGVPVAVTALEDAQVLLNQASAEDESGAYAETIDTIALSIDARLDMLALAPALLSVTEQASVALISSGYAVGDMAAGRKKEDEARKAMDRRKDSHIERSIELYREALVLYKEAVTDLSEASTTFPQSDFGPYLTVVDLRIAMAQEAIKAGKYLLDNKPKQANRAIGRYNEHAAQIEKSAKKGFKDPQTIVVEAYEREVGALAEEYSAARQRAVSLDQLVR